MQILKVATGNVVEQRLHTIVALTINSENCPYRGINFAPPGNCKYLPLTKAGAEDGEELQCPNCLGFKNYQGEDFVVCSLAN